MARQLAALMVRRLLPGDEPRASVDLVTWAPTSSARIAERGFDQAELLARAVARELGVPCRRLLYRAHGGPQAGRGRAARLLGPSFRARAPRRGLRVLLVDDVVTTGGTLARRQPGVARRRRRRGALHRRRRHARRASPQPRPPPLRLAS